MRAAKHVHRLKKYKYPKTGNSIFFCTLPDCHFKIDAPLALGKRSVCNICGDEFFMNEYHLKLIKPHCDKCGRVKVVDADGATRFVKKAANQVLSNVAVEAASDLRSRLNHAAHPPIDDDI